MSDFRRRVLAVVRRIPPGRVATYGDVADWAGRPRAWRAVGNIMRECHEPATPCHRVVGAGGALGGYGGNPQLKRELLRAEGLQVGIARIRRFRDVRWATKVSKEASRKWKVETEK
ncbi:MAG: MGMT family protein [Acidobacteria bacterium]|nr:MGMT family protein [Acidobacteriota bacterium]